MSYNSSSDSTIDYSQIVEVYPPPGVTPSVDTSNATGHALIAVVIIAVLVTTLMVSIRIYTKAFLIRALGADDVTCAIALIGAYIYTAFVCIQGQHGMGYHEWNIHQSIGDWQTYFKAHWIAEEVYFITIGVMKVSLLLLYLRVLSNSRRNRIFIYLALGVIVSATLAAIVVTTADTRPFPCHWIWADGVDGEPCRMVWDDDDCYLFTGALTIVLDLVVLYLPCPAVWRLHLQRRQKIGVLIIMLTGVIVTIASTLRLVYLIQWTSLSYSEDDERGWNTKITMAGVFEVNLGIICTCLPTLKPFLRRHAPFILRLQSSSRSAAQPSQTNKRSGLQHSSSRHLSKAGRKWPTESGAGQLTSSAYLELGEDGKSDQSYAMTAVEVQPRPA